MSLEPIAKEIYCVLIALVDDTLLLPNAAIAETVGQEALTVNESEPLWVAGELQWNRRALTVIRYETLNGAAHAPLTRRARLVVLQALDAETTASPLALVAQSYPHLITVTRDAIAPLPLRPGDDPAVVLARVRVGNSEALIPNLDAMRQRVNNLLDPSVDPSVVASEG
ncbi:MAG: chemotaxis protein CheW [Stagnimonas sp.]|nr:chemotaxis protein CheW [Stagnimonas sp.]